MTKTREEAIKKYWSKAKEKCPFHDETLQNGYLEGFIEGAAEVMKLQDWHDLCKDPNDLPKVPKNKNCIFVLVAEIQYGDWWYETAAFHSSFMDDGEDITKKVLYWKYITPPEGRK